MEADVQFADKAITATNDALRGAIIDVATNLGDSAALTHASEVFSFRPSDIGLPLSEVKWLEQRHPEKPKLGDEIYKRAAELWFDPDADDGDDW